MNILAVEEAEERGKNSREQSGHGGKTQSATRYQNLPSICTQSPTPRLWPSNTASHKSAPPTLTVHDSLFLEIRICVKVLVSNQVLFLLGVRRRFARREERRRRWKRGQEDGERGLMVASAPATRYIPPLRTCAAVLRRVALHAVLAGPPVVAIAREIDGANKLWRLHRRRLAWAGTAVAGALVITVIAVGNPRHAGIALESQRTIQDAYPVPKAALAAYLDHTGGSSKLAKLNPSMAKRIEGQDHWVHGSARLIAGGSIKGRLEALHLHQMVSA